MDVHKLNKHYNIILKSMERIVGNKITNGQELDTVAKIMFGKRYRGLYTTKDKKPKLSAGTGYIENKPTGVHWTASFKLPDGKQYFYDSFDRATFIKPFLDGDWDKKPDQKLSESNCGARTLARLTMALLFDV